MYNGDAPANTPHRPGPGKATAQRLRCRSVSPPAPAQRLVFELNNIAGVCKREILKTTVGSTLL